MPIDIAPPPPASISSLTAVLPKIAGNRGIASKAPLLAQGANRMLQGQGTSDAPRPMLSSPVYVLGLDAIVAGQDLSAAKLAMWTHFFSAAQDDDDRLVAADVNADTSRFASLKVGRRYARSTARSRRSSRPRTSACGPLNSHSCASQHCM